MKTCYIYARTGTISSQEVFKRNSNSITAQIATCERYAKKHGYKVLQVFQDISSSSVTNKPGLTQLLTNISRAKVDAVIILRIDRLSRNVIDYQKIHDQIKEKDVRLVSVGEGDVTEGVGKWIGTIFASFAQYELERSKEE